MVKDDSMMVEDTKKGSLAEVTDDLCAIEFIEIVPLDRPSDDYHTSEFISPVVVIKPEDLQMTQEPADENDSGDSNSSVKDDSADEYDIVEPCFIIPVCSLVFIFHLFVHDRIKQLSSIYVHCVRKKRSHSILGITLTNSDIVS